MLLLEGHEEHPPDGPIYARARPVEPFCCQQALYLVEKKILPRGFDIQQLAEHCQGPRLPAVSEAAVWHVHAMCQHVPEDVGHCLLTYCAVQKFCDSSAGMPIQAELQNNTTQLSADLLALVFSFALAGLLRPHVNGTSGVWNPRTQGTTTGT